MARDLKEAIFGGRTIEVEYQDGERERVLVRELPVRRYVDYMQTLGDEAARVELLTGLGAAAVDSLKPESLRAIVVAGEEVNDPFVQQWAERCTARVARVKSGMPGLVNAAQTRSSGGG